MTSLVIAEHDNAAIKAATLNTIAAAVQCGGDVHVLVAGHNAGAAAAAAAQIAGVAKVIHAENFFVVFHNKATGLFEEVYTVDQNDLPAPPSRLEKSTTAYIFRTGEALIITPETFRKLEALGEVALVGTRSASWIGVPLKTRDDTIGVIVVQDYEREDLYTEDDKNFLAHIGAQVALAIERKQAEGALMVSEARFKTMFDEAPLGIGLTSFIGKFGCALAPMLGTVFQYTLMLHPMVSYGILAGIAAIAALFVKETLGVPMEEEIPELVEEKNRRTMKISEIKSFKVCEE